MTTLLRETKTIFFPIFVFVAAFFLFFFGVGGSRSSVGGVSVSGRAELPVVEDQRPKVPRVTGGQRMPLGVNARAVLVKDIGSGTTIFEKNSADRLPIASLTKLMTALVVVRRVSPEELVEIRFEDTAVAPYKSNLISGERVLVKDLLEAMLISSANDAALALARHAGGSVENFVRFMNRAAEALRMKDTAFENPVGFDAVNHFSTARDLAILVGEFMSHSELMRIVGQKQAVFYSVDGEQTHILTSTNKLLEEPQVLGIKTGYTNSAKGNIIILVDPVKSQGRDPSAGQYFLIVLGSRDREGDAKKIMSWIEDNVVWMK